MKVYFRTPAGPKTKLNSYHITDCHVAEARQTMMESLHESSTVFLNPILVLIDGGKV